MASGLILELWAATGLLGVVLCVKPRTHAAGRIVLLASVAGLIVTLASVLLAVVVLGTFAWGGANPVVSLAARTLTSPVPSGIAAVATALIVIRRSAEQRRSH